MFFQCFQEALKSKRRGVASFSKEDVLSCVSSKVVVGYFGAANGTVTLLIDAACADVMSELARLLKSPRIVVFFQEKSFWEFSLIVGNVDIVHFSTVPDYWEDSVPTRFFGSAEQVSQVWGVSAARIEKYLVDWGLTEEWNEQWKAMSSSFRIAEEKAYSGDEFRYGDMYQGFDFIRALGGDPQGESRFWASVPPHRG